MSAGFDPYAVLGVERGATTLEVARARRRLAKQLHPDLGGNEAAAEQLRIVNRAWHILSDPERRRAWDRQAAPPWSGQATAHRWPQERQTTTWTSWPADAPTRRAPRPRAVASQRSARDSVWLAIVLGGLIVIGLLGAGWLAATQSATTLQEAIAEQGIDPTTLLQLDDRTAVAARWRDEGTDEVIGRLSLLRFGRIGESWELLGVASTAVTAAPAVAIATGRSGLAWPTIAFGYAPEGVTRATLPELDGVGGGVHGGTWAIGLSAADLSADGIAWRLLAADGAVVAEGRGPLHCLDC